MENKEAVMLRLTNVRKNYGTFTLECSLEVRPGMITALIGSNGAGKSTTFQAALDLIPIDAGEITVFGKSHTALTPADKEKIGVVLSDSGFSEYLMVQDIAAILNAMYTRFSKGDFVERCRRFGLPNNKKIKEFSTGMKAKLKMIAAMSHGAKLLILDEPTAGLDVVAREELLTLLQDYLEERGDASVLISSHISGDLEKFCDDIYMIHAGKIILHEETDVLLGSYGVIKADARQYECLDKSHLLYRKTESFGSCLLTDDRQFYQENNSGLVVEKGNIDDVIILMTKGERV